MYGERRAKGTSHELCPWRLILPLGAGGVQRSDIEIYGPESSGKQPPPSHAAVTQKEGGIAAFIDAEHALIHLMQQPLGQYRRTLSQTCDLV